MNKLQATFKKLTPYYHFLVFLIILTVLKIANVFIVEGVTEGLHFSKLGVGLVVISSLLHFIFSKLFDKKKKYLHSLISTFLIVLMLSHADPEPIRGIMVILLLYVAKFFVKYKKQNVFNPVVFTIGTITLLALIIPSLGIPPLDFTGIDIRFPIFGIDVPLPLLLIIMALTFNIARVKRHPVALSFIITSLFLGYFINAYENDIFSYLIIIIFTGTAVVTEPKTSPSKPKEQVIYGITLALIIYVFTVIDVPNPIIIGLLLGNLLWFVYNKFLRKLA